MVNIILGGGPILLAVLIGLTEMLDWKRKLHYAWAGVSLIWGIVMLLL